MTLSNTPEGASRPRIFVNYRRDDTSGHAGRICDSLMGHFGTENVFIDVDSIQPGRDFIAVLTDALDKSDVLISVIGRSWLARKGRLGRRRLDDPGDFVRLELSAALQRDIFVLPVLVQGAKMPNSQQLPDTLRQFCNRQAFEISDIRWRSDMQALIDMLERGHASGEFATKMRPPISAPTAATKGQKAESRHPEQRDHSIAQDGTRDRGLTLGSAAAPAPREGQGTTADFARHSSNASASRSHSRNVSGPTHREATERKLASQHARQVARQRKTAMFGSTAVIALVLVAVVALPMIIRRGNDGTSATGPSNAAGAAPTGTQPATNWSGTCAYPSDGIAAKQNTSPPTKGVSNKGEEPVAITTSAGPIGLTLNRAEAPCTVNSFVSLSEQGYYNGTSCHRLTTGEGLKVLQCGDPTGTGTGGPGYTIPDEAPTTLAPSPSAGGTVIYPRGTVAMAKTARPNSGGSQFFFVYADSTLPPDYTVFGTIDDAGLATIGKIAAAGADDTNGTGDGKPNAPVQIQTVTAS